MSVNNAPCGRGDGWVDWPSPPFFLGGCRQDRSYLEGGHQVGSLEERQLADLVDNGVDLGVGSGSGSLGRVEAPRRCRDAHALGGHTGRRGRAQLASAGARGVPTRHGHCVRCAEMDKERRGRGGARTGGGRRVVMVVAWSTRMANSPSQRFSELPRRRDTVACDWPGDTSRQSRPGPLQGSFPACLLSV